MKFPIVSFFTSFAALTGCGAGEARPAASAPAGTTTPAVASASSVPAGAPRSACAEIASACHDHAKHSAAAQGCHELGHSPDATEEQCSAKRTECLAACQ